MNWNFLFLVEKIIGSKNVFAGTRPDDKGHNGCNDHGKDYYQYEQVVPDIVIAQQGRIIVTVNILIRLIIFDLKS
ncbi:MAG: hypothetical protein NTV01_20910 [Bacteroidia bacterium]|nr:hypothetical protein [Bacteroidia bacterium]